MDIFFGMPAEATPTRSNHEIITRAFERAVADRDRRSKLETLATARGTKGAPCAGMATPLDLSSTPMDDIGVDSSGWTHDSDLKQASTGEDLEGFGDPGDGF